MKAKYVYWKRETRTDAWKFIEESELPDMIQRKGAMFATWMSFESEPQEGEKSDYEKLAVRRFGDLPLDFDAKDDMEKARKTTVEAIRVLKDMGVPEHFFQIFVSGSKGFHVILDRAIFGAEDGDPLLPLIYKDMVNDLFPVNDIRFAALDRSLYCMGHGKMFRLPNVRRENGRFKIPISFDELVNTKDANDFLEMSENPRPLPKKPNYEAVVQLFKLFIQKQAFAHTMARTQKLPKHKIKLAEKELLPCTRLILNSQSKLNSNTTFNEICFSAIVPSLIESGYSHDELPFIPEVETFLENFEDSSGYQSPTERVDHFKNVVSRDRVSPCGYSCGAMLKCMGQRDEVCRSCKPRINAWLASEGDSTATVDVTNPHDDNPDVEFLLNNFSWVHIGGKEAIYQRREDGEQVFLSKGAFEGMFANKAPVVRQEASGKIKQVPITTVWRQHSMRKTFFGGVTFDPSGHTPSDVLNTWRGFPMQVPDMPIEEAANGCKLFRRHVEHLLCQDDPKAIRFLWAWLSDMVKRPGGKKPGSAVVIVGGKGMGKSAIAKPFRKIMGYYCTTLASPDRLLSHFNSGIADKILLVLEEAVWGGSHEAESRLKSLITEQEMVVERKGFDAVQAMSFQRIIMCSNESWVVPSSADERRFFVLDISDVERPSREYFDRLFFEIENGGAECLYAWLLQQKLDDVCLFDPPTTNGLDKQKEESMDSVAAWWHDVLYDGQFTYDDKGLITKPWDDILHTNDAYRSYVAWCKTNYRQRPKARRAFATALVGKNGLVQARKSTIRVDNGLVAVYRVGSLETARADFVNRLHLSESYSWDTHSAIETPDPSVATSDFDI